MIEIDIVSDVICPWCLIGKRRLEAALALRPDSVGTIRWRPFQLNPDMPREGVARTEYVETKFGGPEGAKRVYDRIRAAGADDGIDFRFEDIVRTPNTVDAHCLIHWAAEAGRQDAVVEALFRAYFMEGRDIGDRATLAAIAGEAGLDAEAAAAMLADGTGEAEVQAETEAAYRSGVSGVPCFILDGKYALSGAQPAEVLADAFDRVLAEKRPGAPAA